MGSGLKDLRFGVEETESFTPADIAGLEFWFEPSASSNFQEHTASTPCADGDPIGYSADLSGNGRHFKVATAAKRPVYRANQINGVAAADFDGVDDRLEVGSVVTIAQPLTVVSVYKNDEVSLPSYIRGVVRTNWDDFLLGIYENGYTLRAPTNAYHNGINPTTDPVIHSGIYNGASSVGRKNGGAGSTVNPGTNGIATYPVYIAGSDPGGYFKGKIAAVLIYSGILQDSDLNRLHTYYGSRYGVAVTSVS